MKIVLNTLETFLNTTFGQLIGAIIKANPEVLSNMTPFILIVVLFFASCVVSYVKELHQENKQLRNQSTIAQQVSPNVVILIIPATNL